eukprot:20255-Lingulodinium_polyedra.AAC.1
MHHVATVGMLVILLRWSSTLRPVAREKAAKLLQALSVAWMPAEAITWDAHGDKVLDPDRKCFETTPADAIAVKVDGGVVYTALLHARFLELPRALRIACA